MRRTLTAFLVCLGVSIGLSGVAPAGAARDAAQRLNQLRKSQSQQSPIRQTTSQAKAVSTYYKKPMVALSVPKNLGRTPTPADVVIEGGFDGRTPADALKMVRSKLTNKVLGQNERFVDDTIRGTHKAFTLAVNNAYIPGSAIHGFIKNELAGADVTILGTVSQLNPTIVMAKKPGERFSRYYAQDGRSFTELKKLPYSVVMKARLENGVNGGLRVSYHTWGDERLAGKLVTITELGSGGQ